MSWQPTLVAAILLGLFGSPAGQERQVDLPWELEEVKTLVQNHDLKGAEAAYKKARKELKDRMRDKEVQAALKIAKRQISILKEYVKAEECARRGKNPGAYKVLAKALRQSGEIWIADEVESLYTEVKGKMFWVINDFECEDYRAEDSFRAAEGAEAEVVQDVRIAADGRHALKVHFDARGKGLSQYDSGAYRSVALQTPSGNMEDARAVSFSIYSYRKVHDTIEVDVIGGSLGTTSPFAKHPGLSLNFVGRKVFTLQLNRFAVYDGFDWSDVRRIQISTRGPGAVDFALDDVRILR